MNKQAALDRLSALEKEAKSLREIIEKPEHEVNSIEDVIRRVEPKWLCGVNGDIEESYYSTKDMTQCSTEQLALHTMLYLQLKEVEKYVNDKERGEIDIVNHTLDMCGIFWDYKIGKVVISQNIGLAFNFISGSACSEFIRITGDKLKEFYLTAY